jgi:anti-anti-sigma regulatory factor
MSSALRVGLSATWLTTEDVSEDAVVVRVNGGLSDYRGTELWSDLEWALERAEGRLVVADLLGVTGFDIYALDSLAQVARASRRRHLDFCALMRPASALEQYAFSCELDRLLPIYYSLSNALAGIPEPGHRIVMASRALG